MINYEDYWIESELVNISLGEWRRAEAKLCSSGRGWMLQRRSPVPRTPPPQWTCLKASASEYWRFRTILTPTATRTEPIRASLISPGRAHPHWKGDPSHPHSTTFQRLDFAQLLIEPKSSTSETEFESQNQVKWCRVMRDFKMIV